jgi:hypothetical protein
MDKEEWEEGARITGWVPDRANASASLSVESHNTVTGCQHCIACGAAELITFIFFPHP